MNGSYYDTSMDALRLAGYLGGANKKVALTGAERDRLVEISRAKAKEARERRKIAAAESAIRNAPVAEQMRQIIAEAKAVEAAADPNADLLRLEKAKKKSAHLRKLAKEELEYLERTGKYRSGPMFKRDVEFDIEDVDFENYKLGEEIKALKKRAAKRARKPKQKPSIADVILQYVNPNLPPQAPPYETALKLTQKAAARTKNAIKRRRANAAKLTNMRNALKIENPNQTSSYYNYLLSHQLRPSAKLTKAGRTYFAKKGRKACRAAVTDPRYKDTICDKIKTAAVRRAYDKANKKLVAAGLDPIY